MSKKIKKVCVFGATGKTGQRVLEELIKRNYEINAFVRNPRKINNPEINVYTGNLYSLFDVQKSVEGCSAVISALGHTKNSDPEMQTKAISNIINSMQKFGIKKIISLTGTGVRQKGDKVSFLDMFANLLIEKIDPARIKDGIKHAEKLKFSNLDWVIIRVLKLTNRGEETFYRLKNEGPAELLTSRKKVSKIIVDLLETDRFDRQMPIVSK